MHDFSIAAAPSDPISPALLQSALQNGHAFSKAKDYIMAERAYWESCDPRILDCHDHHLRNFLGEGHGVIDRAQALTTELLLHLGYLYEDTGQYEYAACCYHKASMANKHDTYAWQRYHDMTDEHGVIPDEDCWNNLMHHAAQLRFAARETIPQQETLQTSLNKTRMAQPERLYNAA